MFIGAALGIAAERPARHGPGAGDRHGYRRDVLRHAAAAADLDAAGDPAAGRRRTRRHARRSSSRWSVAFVVTAVAAGAGSTRGSAVPARPAASDAGSARATDPPTERAEVGCDQLRLNAAIAWLFMVGSACFVLGSVPAYVNAVGGMRSTASPISSVRSSSPRRRSASSSRRRAPSMTASTTVEPAHSRPGARSWGWLPHDRNWLAAAVAVPRHAVLQHQHHGRTRPQRDGGARPTGTSGDPTSSGRSLFLVASAFGVLAVSAAFLSGRPRVVARGGSPGSTCSAPCCSWPRRWPASSCPSPMTCSARRLAVAGTLLGRRVLPRRRGADAPGLATCSIAQAGDHGRDVP